VCEEGKEVTSNVDVHTKRYERYLLFERSGEQERAKLHSGEVVRPGSYIIIIFRFYRNAKRIIQSTLQWAYKLALSGISHSLSLSLCTVEKYFSLNLRTLDSLL